MTTPDDRPSVDAIIHRQAEASLGRDRHIGYIVLPPAHGKTHNHLAISNLYDAGSLVGCTSTDKLTCLRTIAKNLIPVGGAYAAWNAYDRVYARELDIQIGAGRHVVLVPSGDIGIAANWTWLGSFVLSQNEWMRNLEARGETITPFYNWSMLEVKSSSYPVYEFSQTQDLREHIIRLARDYIDDSYVEHVSLRGSEYHVHDLFFDNHRVANSLGFHGVYMDDDISFIPHGVTERDKTVQELDTSPIL